jgi:FkbM family methyltransferase
LKWSGVLIEPIPEIYNQLIKNRNNNNHFYNCALVSSYYNQEEIKLYFNKEDSLRLQAKKIDNNLKKDSRIIAVKCKTLEKALDDIEIPKLIDLFSLDVEGSEIDVLQGINFDSVKFKYILIETASPEKINNFLLTKNYHLIERLSNYNFLEQPNFGDYLYKTY